MLRTPSTNWPFIKMFSDGEFIASGQVCIRPNCEKPVKNVKDNTYVRAHGVFPPATTRLISSPQIFFVIEGVVEARIHANTYTVGAGGSFMVPRGQRSFLPTSGPSTRIYPPH